MNCSQNQQWNLTSIPCRKRRNPRLFREFYCGVSLAGFGMPLIYTHAVAGAAGVGWVGFQMIFLCRTRLSTKCGLWTGRISITWELIINANTWSYPVLLNSKLWELDPAVRWTLNFENHYTGWSFLHNSYFYTCVFGPPVPFIWYASFFPAWQAPSQSLKTSKKYPILFVSFSWHHLLH